MILAYLKMAIICQRFRLKQFLIYGCTVLPGWEQDKIRDEYLEILEKIAELLNDIG